MIRRIKSNFFIFYSICLFSEANLWREKGIQKRTSATGKALKSTNRKKMSLEEKKEKKFAIFANQCSIFSKYCKCLLGDLQILQHYYGKKRERISTNCSDE